MEQTHNINPLGTRFSRQALGDGMRDGVPIGLGYFAVSFSLGIAAKNAGLTPFQGFLASLLCNASAGEYAGFTLIAAGAISGAGRRHPDRQCQVSADELRHEPAAGPCHARIPPAAHGFSYYR